MRNLAPESRRAIDRAINGFKAHGENGSAYLLVALSTLATTAPDAANFALDHADRVAGAWPSTSTEDEG